MVFRATQSHTEPHEAMLSCVAPRTARHS